MEILQCTGEHKAQRETSIRSFPSFNRAKWLTGALSELLDLFSKDQQMFMWMTENKSERRRLINITIDRQNNR